MAIAFRISGKFRKLFHVDRLAGELEPSLTDFSGCTSANAAPSGRIKNG
jgi:hypothetical protein